MPWLINSLVPHVAVMVMCDECFPGALVKFCAEKFESAQEAISTADALAAAKYGQRIRDCMHLR